MTLKWPFGPVLLVLGGLLSLGFISVFLYFNSFVFLICAADFVFLICMCVFELFVKNDRLLYFHYKPTTVKTAQRCFPAVLLQQVLLLLLLAITDAILQPPSIRMTQSMWYTEIEFTYKVNKR